MLWDGGAGAGAGVVGTLVEGAPGARGSGPVEMVGVWRGAVRVGCAGVVPVRTVTSGAPGPSGTLVFVAVRVALELDVPLTATATAAPPAARASRARLGQIQSPGYHVTRRCQPEARTPTTPRLTGRRSPQSRQYS
jgi:hypothetical protein